MINWNYFAIGAFAVYFIDNCLLRKKIYSLKKALETEEIKFKFWRKLYASHNHKQEADLIHQETCESVREFQEPVKSPSKKIKAKKKGA
ncbi:MAG TPA: hypothetical protein VNU45_17985 [Rummeliibacillus sp.]|nr:hypothetical protein [Rummeliibacillus sp.]